MPDRILPVLRLAVLCEEVVFDGEGNPFALNVPLHTLQMPPNVTGRYRPPTLSLYLQLSDGVGVFYVATEVRNEGGTVQYRSRPPVEVVFPGTAHRATPLEVVIELNGLEFPSPGLYEILVTCNHASLHEARPNLSIPYPPVRVNVIPSADSGAGTP